MRRLAGVVVPPVLLVAALVAAWWTATAVFAVQPFVLPSPGKVAAVFTEQGGYLYRSTRTTAVEATVGYGIAAVLGLVIGVGLASWPPLVRAVLPVLVGLDAIPKLALAPVLLVWLGLGWTPKVVIVTATCLLPVVLATMGGLRSTPAEYIELARSLSASGWKKLTMIRLPFAVPRIFVGLKIAAPLAVIGAVVSEFFGATAGLGYAIRAAGADIALVYAALFLLAAMSLTLFYLVTAAERWAAPWAKEVGA